MTAVTGLLHHAIRIGMTDEDVDKAAWFYGEILGLEKDQGRPYVPGIPGLWYNIGRNNQVHLMGNPGQKVIDDGGKWEGDPTVPHMALQVDDLDAMVERLVANDIRYWEGSPAGMRQVFLKDPFGNQIELQQER